MLSICLPARVAVGMSDTAMEIPPVRGTQVVGARALKDGPCSRGATAEQNGWEDRKKRRGIAHHAKGFTALSLISQF